MSTIISSLPDIPADLDPQGRSYTVYTFYCNGGTLTEHCTSAGIATKLYTRRLIAGITSTDQQSSPLRPPFHVVTAALLMRGGDNEIVHEIYSPIFPCTHGDTIYDTQAMIAIWRDRLGGDGDEVSSAS